MSDIPKLVPVRMAASVSQQRRHIADVVRGVGRLPLHCGPRERDMSRYDLFKVRGVGRLPLHCGASRRMPPRSAAGKADPLSSASFRANDTLRGDRRKWTKHNGLGGWYS